MNKRKSTITAYVIMSVMAVVFILPLLWVVFASFNPDAGVGLKLPSQWVIENYQSVFSETKNVRSFGIGLVLSIGVSLLEVIVCALASYPLSRYELRYKKTFMYTILFMSCLPMTALMIPAYRLFVTLHLMDNLLGVVLFMAATQLPYNMWMMKNFMDQIPVELEEAAWVDGAGKFKSLFRIVIPLMTPGLCTIGIHSFASSWGNFFTPFILLTSTSNYPAAVRLFQFFGTHGVNYGHLAAYSVIYSIPSIVLYSLAQSFMSKGFVMQGANKG